MQTVRRVYFLFVSAVSLGMLLSGAASIGSTLTEWLLSPGAIDASFRQTIARSAALALIGLPIWALHWSVSQRYATRDAAERRATLRRLYLYGVMAALLLGTGVFATRVIEEALLLLLRESLASGVRLLRATWQLSLCLVFWLYHFRWALADRAAVGEEGGSATLRRWYTYATLAVSAIVVLFGAREMLTLVGLSLVDGSASEARHVAAVVSRTLVALGIGLFHARPSKLRVDADDRRATLRAVAGFGVLALSVTMVVSQTSRALYYGLARLLGVESPGGERGPVAALLVSPAATILVFGVAWALTRRALVADAAETEAPRQAGVRRLYTHLVALVALLALATGVAGILWTLVDVLTEPTPPVSPSSRRDQASLFLTLIIVGLPMWLAHWRSSPSATERAALSRRLYLFAALLVSVLTILGSGAYTIQQLLALMLGAESPTPWAAILRAASVSVVALAVALYHFRVLRLDGEQRTAEAPPGAPPPQTSVVVEVTGATREEVAAALTSLPASARYTFRTD